MIVQGLTLNKLSYQQRLKRPGLMTLEERRERGDLIEMYRILTGKKNSESNQFFQLSSKNRDMRGHTLELFERRSSRDVASVSKPRFRGRLEAFQRLSQQ